MGVKRIVDFVHVLLLGVVSNGGGWFGLFVQ